MLAAVIPGSRSSHVPTSNFLEPNNRRAYATTRPFLRHEPPNMFHAAVQQHDKENARTQPSSIIHFKSSPPETAKEQKPPSQTTNPNYRNPLKPAASSMLNSARSLQSRQGAVSGTKRTASGLAKATDGSFDDGPGSQLQPIVVAGGGGGMARPQAQFDENDFDDDIDLDFEEPKSTVNYPKLPQQPAMSVPSKSSIVYPTLPKQQQAQPALSRAASQADSGYVSYAAGTDKSLPPPESSAELPWGSSPAEHHEPSQIRSTISQFVYNPSAAQARHDGSPPKPAKRSKLPWLSEVEEAQTQPLHATKSTKSKIKSGPGDFTPLPKDSKKALYPWNTTASAVKDQQKKFREEHKKAVKKNEGMEDDLRKAKSTRTRPARVFLSEEQQHVLDLVTEHKKSAFFTGSAGTGKSVLLREIIASLRKKFQREPDRVAVTASTGLAACNVGGVTLHSFAGIGLGKEDVPELVRKIKRNQKAKHRWMRTKVLVIDEVSMVDADLFDKLESIARQLRNNGRPFGGIQLVITGDFFQLPPVPDSNRIAKFAFDAATWNTTIEHTIGLHHVFRQKDPGKIIFLCNQVIR